MPVPAVNLLKLETLFAQLERNGVDYGLGAKAPSLDSEPAKIKKIDCSGFVRYALYKATKEPNDKDGVLTLPDGSQNQRAWCEQKTAEGELNRVANYADAAKYMTGKRLFICFIRPGFNGCGPVGHVWLLAQYNDGDNGTLAGTLESHGGVGIHSRAWNTRTLVNEFYSAYELPTS